LTVKAATTGKKLRSMTVYSNSLAPPDEAINSGACFRGELAAKSGVVLGRQADGVSNVGRYSGSNAREKPRASLCRARLMNKRSSRSDGHHLRGVVHRLRAAHHNPHGQAF